MKNVKDFVAIDVETANHHEDICQVGIAVVKNGVIRETRVWMVQPPNNHYDEPQMYVHGITPDHTKDSPYFDAVWEELHPYLAGQVLVAHNHYTEERVLSKNVTKYGIFPIGVNIHNIECTCEMHQGRNLKDVCQAYGLSYEGHHDAGFDAERCAQFYLNCQNGVTPNWSLVVNTKKTSIYKTREHLSGSELEMDLSRADKNSPFYQKKVVITGLFSVNRTELARILREELGADIDSSISKRTHFVFIGTDPGPAKLDKVNKLIHDGFNIQKLYEEDVVAIINGDWAKYGVNELEYTGAKALNLTTAHYERKHLCIFDDCSWAVIDKDAEELAKKQNKPYRQIVITKSNPMAMKNFCICPGMNGDILYFMQMIGNFSGSCDKGIYPDTHFVVLPTGTLDCLNKGEKNEAIRYIEEYYNKQKSRTFDMFFVNEEDLLRYIKWSCIKNDNEPTLELYDKYINSFIENK